MEDLHDIPVVSLAFFLEYLLPLLPASFDIEKVKTQLNADGVTTGTGWKAFKQRPKSSKAAKTALFRALQDVYDGVANSTLKSHSGYKQVLKMKYNRNKSPLSERIDMSRPDSILELLMRLSVLVDEGDNSNWENIPVSMEFKKGDGEKDRFDNRAKILWSLHHMMRNDPCRRFAFGITIENTTTRLWFCCRTTVLVSKPFDLFNDRNTVIRTFASLAFASNKDLGYDPTITRVLVDDRPQYDIKVTDKVYRTTDVLSNFGADTIIGHGTRVFKVYDEQDVHKTPRVLKDAWVEADRSREGQILENLFAKIKSQGGEEKLRDAKQYFLTSVTWGDVEIDGVLDDTEKLIMRGGDLLKEDPMQLLVGNLTRDMPSHRSERRRRSNIGNVPVFEDPLKRKARPRSEPIPVRVHHRMVCEEVGVAIHHLTSLRDVYHSLNDAMKGLKIMHQYSYVHRDISTGNILFHEGQGKLSDLEYAKEMTVTGGGHEDRTGIAYFMAIEVAAQKYVFERPGDLDLDAPDRPFQYNPLHDIESIWWITNYFLFRHFTEPDHVRKDLDKDAHTLFPSDNNTSGRNDTFRSKRSYVRMLLHLPVSFHAHGRKMNTCRHNLYLRYEQAESGDSIDESAFDGTIHDLFIDALTELRDSPTSEQAVVTKSQSKPLEREENEKPDEEDARVPKKRKIGDFEQTDIRGIWEERPKGKGHQLLIEWKGDEEKSWVAASKVTNSEVLATWYERKKVVES